MDAVNLFKLASTQAKWLSLRQTTVANNIANADSPGYRAVDVEPFKAALDSATVRLGATSPNHVGAQPEGASFKVVDEKPAGLTTAGKPVSLEDELVKSAEIRHAFETNTAIVGAFHRMILMTAKGS
ncbi:flagellar basal body protein [Oricola nitratireducens]|jgi:flagellar basal-body rod protein FlgB|uniref:flagellar basal body protein n=1 Tax=Oricola nitratireducens TaxID=2775868 RepID=UPI001866941A|nr:flagellar basal body protein [Oricola nitratireducens]